VLVGREHGIEHLFNFPAADDQRQSLEQRHAFDGEGRQLERLGERKCSSLSTSNGTSSRFTISC
jgi:hypothetical protein